MALCFLYLNPASPYTCKYMQLFTPLARWMPYGLKRGCGNLAKFGITTATKGPACWFVGWAAVRVYWGYHFVLSKFHWAFCNDVAISTCLSHICHLFWLQWCGWNHAVGRHNLITWKICRSLSVYILALQMPYNIYTWYIIYPDLLTRT